MGHPLAFVKGFCLPCPISMVLCDDTGNQEVVLCMSCLLWLSLTWQGASSVYQESTMSLDTPDRFRFFLS